MCEEIKRSDLKVYIRKVYNPVKMKLYDLYWDKLKRFIDSSRPKRDLVDLSLEAIPLGSKKRRLR